MVPTMGPSCLKSSSSMSNLMGLINTPDETEILTTLFFLNRYVEGRHLGVMSHIFDHFSTSVKTSSSVIIVVYPMHLKIQSPTLDNGFCMEETKSAAISNVFSVIILTLTPATKVLILPADLDCGV